MAPIDLRSIPQWLGLGNRNADPKVDYIAGHEEHVRLRERMLDILGLTQKEIRELIKEAEKDGLKEQSRDAFRIRMQEPQRRPRLYLFRYEGGIRALSAYINGVISEKDGLTFMESPPHPRTWVLGAVSQLGVNIEESKEKIEAYWRSQVPERFSELVWSTWDAVKEMM